MSTQGSDRLSKGDIISFIALLLMGVIVFFGMNFKTLGDKVPSIIVALLLVVVMTVFVFLAAHAKAQNRNQAMWRNVEYAMLGLYILALVPCYIYGAKFFDIYFDKASITQQVQTDIEGINKMFADYNKKCESRCNSYQIALESMLNDSQGREKLAALLEINEDEVTKQNVLQAAESFSNMLKGGDYKILEAEKNSIENNLLTNIRNWNILFIPQYVSELETARSKYTKELKNIYIKHKNDIETNVPEFNTNEYVTESSVKEIFAGNTGFSGIGLLAIIILGALGLVKYILGEKRTVIDFQEGDATSITEDGGFTIG